MRQKYIDERFPDWITHGTFPALGMECVTNQYVDLRVPADEVAAVIEQLQATKEMLVLVVQALDECNPTKLSEIWYGA